MYPVISTVGTPHMRVRRKQLLSSGVPVARSRSVLAPSQCRVAQTPPTLLIHAGDDTSVPVENSLLMYDALRTARVRSELHVFDSGGHGFGLRGVAGRNVAIWPTLVQNWAMNHVNAHA